MFDWMVWTTPVAIFFGCVVLLLAGMTVWELRSPTRLRKGFLPIATTRGDRLFIGLMCAAWVNLFFVGMGERIAAWFALEQPWSVWVGFAVSMLLLAFIMRRG
ncbi:DUF2160 domain-containing protein [Bordetella genomosp. 13]|uniref:DUF2160 domain-containing protein n=1 Tax=Bordetella genomosp. 13 TaxID=463040 RepID=A0A1W6Z9V8_9BORD|nr:DUF2160 domain-containing protein [Bordetella genomosp. 13]ARP94186.1 hypothetical protein CAL15_07195 [Bordetella genomosp. 13]